MSVIFATQLTAVATAVLSAFAIITAVVAYMAFRKQAQEVGILQQQMKEQQEVLAREGRERHRAQASRVFMSLVYESEESARFNVANTSEQPVYNAEILWRTSRDGEGVLRHEHLGTILPGDRPSVDCHPTRGDPHTLPDPDDYYFTRLTFSDASGAMWTRELSGDLSETPGWNAERFEHLRSQLAGLTPDSQDS